MVELERVWVRETKKYFAIRMKKIVKINLIIQNYPQKAIHSKLKQSAITDKEYEPAINCWKDAACKTIKDYMLIFL